MSSLSPTALIAIFAVGAGVTWIAGLYLARTTDVLDTRLNLGEAMGGMILLAIAGSLPELAITVSGAVQGHVALVAGNLIGGIAMQTMVLAMCDFALRGKRPLSYLVASLGPVLEALLVVLVVTQVVLGAILPSSFAVGGVSPMSMTIVITWIVGMVVLNRTRQTMRWSLSGTPDEADEPVAARADADGSDKPGGGASTRRVIAVFLLASGATLLAGVALESSGNALASYFGINGVVFGATVLALATALPEISTGVAAVRLGDYHLAMSDIYGGNAFQVCLFLLADLITRQPTMADAGASNEWLAGLGVLLTAVFAFSVVVRPRHRRLRLGLDSHVAVAVYALGMVGLFVLAQ